MHFLGINAIIFKLRFITQTKRIEIRESLLRIRLLIISVNTLVNQLFMSYANFDRYFQRLGLIKISKVTFRKILNAAPANEIVEVAREVAQNSSTVIILAKYGTMSLTSVLEYLNNYADYSSFVERSEVVSPGGKRVITLIHSYGEKGSIFVKAYAKALFELIDMEPKLSSTENSVTIEV
jgi:hypothetical protein